MEGAFSTCWSLSPLFLTFLACVWRRKRKTFLLWTPRWPPRRCRWRMVLSCPPLKQKSQKTCVIVILSLSARDDLFSFLFFFAERSPPLAVCLPLRSRWRLLADSRSRGCRTSCCPSKSTSSNPKCRSWTRSPRRMLSGTQGFVCSLFLSLSLGQSPTLSVS